MKNAIDEMEDETYDFLTWRKRPQSRKRGQGFRGAKAEHAILFFDEIDGLLQDRAEASHGWEVMRVNELLLQMEEFNGVMVAVKFADEDAAELCTFHNLAFGDFRTMRQAQYYLGDEVTNADCLAALREESEAKPKNLASGAIGF